MLAKCVNPACSATFHYFHEGKLFPIESRIDSETRGSASNLEFTGRPHRLQYFWLCSSCCHVMTVQSGGEDGVRIVRTRRVRPDGSMVNDRLQMVA
jgi:hypothetical protein